MNTTLMHFIVVIHFCSFFYRNLYHEASTILFTLSSNFKTKFLVLLKLDDFKFLTTFFFRNNSSIVGRRGRGSGSGSGQGRGQGRDRGRDSGYRLLRAVKGVLERKEEC